MSERALTPEDSVTSEEAGDLLGAAVARLGQLEERIEDGLLPSRAVPRDILNVGEAQAFLAFLIALIALRYPQLVNDDDKIPDVAALRYRVRN